MFSLAAQLPGLKHLGVIPAWLPTPSSWLMGTLGGCGNGLEQLGSCPPIGNLDCASSSQLQPTFHWCLSGAVKHVRVEISFSASQINTLKKFFKEEYVKKCV